MKLRADYTKTEVANIYNIPWSSSPTAGVERKMLDRDGDEVARCTTVVRFLPGTSFPEHVHGGGEEFLVLEGIFSDAAGDYPALTYCRHPIGSKHAPWTKPGCQLLVKLRFMTDTEEKESTIVDTTIKTKWQNTDIDGRLVLPLFSSQKTTEHSWMEEWKPETCVSWTSHTGGEEVFVVDGGFEDEYGLHEKGTWIRTPPSQANAKLPRKTKTGCKLFVKSGHLQPFVTNPS